MIEEKILHYLHLEPCTTKMLYKRFNNRISSENLQSTLKDLQEKGLIFRERIQTGGRPVDLFTLCSSPSRMKLF